MTSDSLRNGDLYNDNNDDRDGNKGSGMQSVTFAAATGSGKTLSYLLPLIQSLKSYLGSMRFVVLGEVDTMLEQGFQDNVRKVLHPLLYRHKGACKGGRRRRAQGW